MQQFCLRWNNHQPNFISVFSALLHNENLVDVTLAAEGSQLQAHKVVLSACSTYFEVSVAGCVLTRSRSLIAVLLQTLFILNPCKHPIVILKDVRYSDLKTLVDFMYYGEVNVSQERLPHIIKTAEMLKIKGLAEMSDAASLSKSADSKVSGVGMGSGEQLSAGNLNDGESVWQSQHQQQPHPQFQQQQDAQHQQQPPQQQPTQQQSQLQQLQLLQQHHHHQLHQARRTPSPTTMSPATRRKRLRKSSTGGLEFTMRKEAQQQQQQAPVVAYATEEEFRQATGAVAPGDEPPASTMEGIATIAHLETMTSFGAPNSNNLGLSSAASGPQRLIKESGSDMEHSHQHVHHHNPHHQGHHDVGVDDQPQQQHIIMVGPPEKEEGGSWAGRLSNVCVLPQKSESHELQPLDITTSVAGGGQHVATGCGAQHAGERSGRIPWTGARPRLMISCSELVRKASSRSLL